MVLNLHLGKVLGVALAVGVLFTSGSFMAPDRLHAAPKSELQLQVDSAQLVNVNKAGSEELQTVRGIGPALAERIIAYRDEHGPFKQVDDLALVHGIGGAKLQKIKQQISL